MVNVLAVFRVDASVKIGTGHVMRCLTLAKGLRKEGAQILFISANLPGNLINHIEENEFPVKVIPLVDLMAGPSQDALHTSSILKNLQQQVDWLIVDHYGLDYQWEKELEPLAKRIMVIDDLANRHHYCDILLDQNLYIDMDSRYSNLLLKECKALLGPQYALLREEFEDLKDKRWNRGQKAQRLFVFYGGSDPTNETLKTLRAIITLGCSQEVDVVVGESNPKKDVIREICSLHKNLHFHCQIDNIAELMNRSDIALGAGGTTVWERCYLGLPTLISIVADNQIDITKAVAQKGAAINLGWHENVTEEEIRMNLSGILSDEKKIYEMSKSCFNIMGFEGLGINKVIHEIMSA